MLHQLGEGRACLLAPPGRRHAAVRAAQPTMAPQTVSFCPLLGCRPPTSGPQVSWSIHWSEAGSTIQAVQQVGPGPSTSTMAPCPGGRPRCCFPGTVSFPGEQQPPQVLPLNGPQQPGPPGLQPHASPSPRLQTADPRGPGPV
ncbi:hypothetical protein NDU88_000508 [Pleurodeles waltl]|uniref:Uncharacterized protein n=1 Tax=Pleurodeles waltl TaxID=8319 RepID=A0AAV7P3Y3_PLEWA|nr:hypothetical protein NDU88_000508 [Pleurodeles waltl]